MFTGIIEETGRLMDRIGGENSLRIRVDARIISEELRPGDSVAVDGVCLTAEKIQKNGFTAYASPETLSRTTLGEKASGSPVNLERALPVSGRLNGHYVMGHVDGIGYVVSIKRETDSWRFAFTIPESVHPYCVEKGSIAVDGISLTIAGIHGSPAIVEVAVIPYTWDHTTLSALRAGAPINLEADILAKYVRNFLGPLAPDNMGVTESLLRKAGFMP